MSVTLGITRSARSRSRRYIGRRHESCEVIGAVPNKIEKNATMPMRIIARDHRTSSFRMARRSIAWR